MIIDTTVLVDLIRGNQEARKFIDPIVKPKISVITKLELIKGARSKQESREYQQLFPDLNVETIHLSIEISQAAESLFIRFFLTHGLGIMDALIAATAIVNHEKLATHNAKHFSFIPKLKIIKPY